MNATTHCSDTRTAAHDALDRIGQLYAIKRSISDYCATVLLNRLPAKRGQLVDTITTSASQ